MAYKISKHIHRAEKPTGLKPLPSVRVNTFRWNSKGIYHCLVFADNNLGCPLRVHQCLSRKRIEQ